MTNIKYYRKKIGMSQEEFAQKIGVAQGAVSQWESGKRTPSLEAVLKMSDILGVSTELLLDKKSENQAWKDINIKPVPRFSDNAFVVPLVASLRCGYNSSGQPLYDVLQEVELPISFKYKYGEDIVLVKAIGESMLNTIRPKDLLISKPGEWWESGNVVIVNIDDSDTIKRIFRADDGGIDLVPDNSDYRTMHFSPSDLQDSPPHVLGRIVRNLGQDI